MIQASGLRDNGDGTWTARAGSESYTGTREECEWWLRMNEASEAGDRTAAAGPPPLRERLKGR